MKKIKNIITKKLSIFFGIVNIKFDNELIIVFVILSREELICGFSAILTRKEFNFHKFEPGYVSIIFPSTILCFESV